jgi:opacity protein-like surface antigen
MRNLKMEKVKMIRFASAIAALIFLISSFAFAQGSPAEDSTPKVEVFGGYSLMHADTGKLNGNTLDIDLSQFPNTFGVKTNFNGWSAEAQYNFDPWLGIVADFGGRYGTPITSASSNRISGLPTQTSYSFLAGPVISYRARKKITPYVHALFGWDRTSLSASTLTGTSSPVSSAATTYTDFTMALGGGVDYKLSRRFALRLGQVDWFHTSLNLNSFYGSAFGVGLFQGLATHERNLRFSTGIVFNF